MSNLLPVTTILGCKNSMLREGLRHVLSSTRFRLHSENLTRGEVSLDPLDQESPLLFIIDASLYPSDLADGIWSLKQRYGQARIVVLSDSFNLEGMKSAFQSGADGYCLASTGCEALIKYLDLVMLGEVVFPSAAFLSAISGSSDGGRQPPFSAIPPRNSTFRMMRAAFSGDSPGEDMLVRHCVVKRFA